MTLPYDYARCMGTTDPVCTNCRRREPGRPEWQSFIAQQPERPGECSMQMPIYTLGGISDKATQPSTCTGCGLVMTGTDRTHCGYRCPGVKK